MFERDFPAYAQATMVYPASVAGLAGVLAAASNLGRADLKLQGAGPFYLSPLATVNGSNSLFVASGVILDEVAHVGPVYVQSAAVNGATVAIAVWEASM
jgi:hypothetical protein